MVERVCTIQKHDETPMPVVNMVSVTVGGSKSHGVHTAFIQTQEALERLGVDVRVNSRGRYDIVHHQTMGVGSFFQLMSGRDRAVVTAHVVPDLLVGSFALAPLWLPLGAAYMRAFYNLADEVLAVSPEVGEGLKRMGVKVPVRVVPNAVDPARFQAKPGWREEMREAAGVPADAFVAICVGQIQPRKGIDAFLETARAMPDVSFIWVGGMPFRRLTDHYRQMLDAVDKAPSNCHFVGEVPHDDMPKWFAAADCLFFPSFQEGHPFAAIEAAAAGLPLILRDIPIYELFDDAYLAGSERTFAEQIARLRDDDALRSEYARRAADLSARFDTVQLAEQLVSVYQDVLARSESERARPARRLRPMLQWALGSGRTARR